MKILRHLLIVSILAAPLGRAEEKSGLEKKEQGAAKDGKKRAVVDVRALLEKGRASGSLPEGMIVRISACLGEPGEAAGNRLPVEMRETWEFTSGHVRLVRAEENADKRAGRPADIRPYETKGLCNELLAGKALEIQARKGEGAEVGFIGSAYHRGGRSIEMTWAGETVLHLFETNGPFLSLYRETDARAFGALYERLASQARIVFSDKAAPTP